MEVWPVGERADGLPQEGCEHKESQWWYIGPRGSLYTTHGHLMLGQGVSPGQWWQGQGSRAWARGGFQCSSSLPTNEGVYQNFNVSYDRSVKHEL